ncbi:MAG: immunoglobulin domain-containing protein, partial [Rhodoferax sp.]|nr:immunoglobulin domain-containing protein [Rhodoferax sp.]
MAPTITTQPVAISVTAGQAASFSVVATGTAPLRYQWKKNGVEVTAGVGGTSSTYTTPATVDGDNNAVFTVVVSNSAGTVTSNTTRLTVAAAAVVPAITTQPAAQTVTAGQSATFSVTATGTSPSYQWTKNGSNISGATSSTYTTPATSSADNAAVFTVVVSNSAGTVTSSSATLTVNVPPSITTQPAAQVVNAGQAATFSVTATGTAPLLYQWKKNGVDVTTGVGATSSTYTTPATVVGDSGAVFTVVVSNNLSTVTSSSATLTVQRYSRVAIASGGTYGITECVKDNNTGLVWEGKTVSPSSTRLATSTYSNYDNVASAQKLGGGTPTPTEVNASTNSIGYVNSVNASALCGYTDWRMPTKEELLGIVDTGQASAPKI